MGKVPHFTLVCPFIRDNQTAVVMIFGASARKFRAGDKVFLFCARSSSSNGRVDRPQGGKL
jgi:aspartate 1-decarboxylase